MNAAVHPPSSVVVVGPSSAPSEPMITSASGGSGCPSAPVGQIVTASSVTTIHSGSSGSRYQPVVVLIVWTYPLGQRSVRSTGAPVAWQGSGKVTWMVSACPPAKEPPAISSRMRVIAPQLAVTRVPAPPGPVIEGRGRMRSVSPAVRTFWYTDSSPFACATARSCRPS